MAISNSDLCRQMQMMDPYGSQYAQLKYLEMRMKEQELAVRRLAASQESETNLLLLIEDETP